MGAFIRVRFCALAFSIGALVVTLSAASIFRSMQEAEPIVAGAGVTAQRMLSATEPSLADGPGDTPVFELAGAPGGTMLLLGGTHPQEIGGVMAAILMVENARVRPIARVSPTPIRWKPICIATRSRRRRGRAGFVSACG
jgi:hypothetical protein